MEKSQPIIQVKDLTKHYPEIKAVNGISFDVFQGEIFGLLGPNGAGKTTTLEIIETLRKKAIYGRSCITKRVNTNIQTDSVAFNKSKYQDKNKREYQTENNRRRTS